MITSLCLLRRSLNGFVVDSLFCIPSAPVQTKFPAGSEQEHWFPLFIIVSIILKNVRDATNVNILTHSLLNTNMKNNNIYQSFVDNLKTEEQDIVKALDSFIKYLGFDDFERTDTQNIGHVLTTEVLGFDDRRIFISVIDNKDCSITGRYVITDKDVNVLDIITFNQDNDEWSEYEL